ncbi:metallophosphoesterase [Paenibacillus sp. SC116]|uniref:metallophosphoesterase n=1 Tax=Paenibacillus sp. SC116 TaxID=2968986 RepID=UPI00215A1AE2|nr:metallophosphoesterase [Paenibacillus sp. SC116]MCR8842997.1 metallophosphoesterase [Paenibacillus sp. SC116]
MTGLAAEILLVVCAAIMGAGLILILLMISMKKEASSFTVTEEDVFIDDLPHVWDGTRLFFITDLHRRSFTAEHVSLLARHPSAELVLLGGDIIEQGVTIEQAMKSVEQLSKIAPIVMVHGNHDHKCNTAQLDAELIKAGVKILDNTAMRCEKDGEAIWLCGIGDSSSGYANVRLAFARSDSEPSCTIVLAHDPVVIREKLPSYVQLVLTGHTHGGQIRLPIYGPLRLNQFYRRYLSGWYGIISKHVPNHAFQLFISNGFGTSHVPMRWNAKPQGHFITLRRYP